LRTNHANAMLTRTVAITIQLRSKFPKSRPEKKSTARGCVAQSAYAGLTARRAK
jgi:hypothetical protein